MAKITYIYVVLLGLLIISACMPVDSIISTSMETSPNASPKLGDVLEIDKNSNLVPFPTVELEPRVDEIQRSR